MLVTFKLLHVVLLLSCLLATGCGPPSATLPTAPTILITPDDKMFSGKAGGCGDFFVYRFDASGKFALSVSVDETKLDWATAPVTIEIEANVANARVEVLQFREPPPSYFCDDVADDDPPLAAWEAVAGQIVIERAQESPPPEFRNATHQISVTLRGVHFRNTKTGEIATFDHVEIKDVQVGWYAG